jgi:hypothetical protein
MRARLAENSIAAAVADRLSIPAYALMLCCRIAKVEPASESRRPVKQIERVDDCVKVPSVRLMFSFC